MNVFNINGIDYLHIQGFADIIGRSQQSTRHLIDDGNSVRRMKAFRDRSRLMIPVAELVGFPFVNQGKQTTGQDIYHYKAYDANEQEVPALDALNRNDVHWKREFCAQCTFSQDKCILRVLADGLTVPQGDK